jgi:hypothetical protein
MATVKERVKTWSDRWRARLIKALGSVCVGCGEDDPAKLEFHHTKPRTWTARDIGRDSRIRMYWADFDDDAIELRCGPCNKRAGRPREQSDDGEWKDEIDD